MPRLISSFAWKNKTMIPTRRLLLFVALLVVLPLKAQPFEIEEFNLPAGSRPSYITAGPDGAMWFSFNSSQEIGRIDVSGTLTRFSVSAFPGHITTGPDGNLWFGATEFGGDASPAKIGRLTPAGVVTIFDAGYGQVRGITSGGDGNLWYCLYTRYGGRIRRMNVNGQSIGSDFVVIPASVDDQTYPEGITATGDGSIWFTDPSSRRNGRIGRIQGGTLRMFPLPVPSAPISIVPAGDGGVWFTDSVNGLGKMSAAGAFSYEGVLPPNLPTGIARASDGEIWTTLTRTSSIARYNPATKAAPSITATKTANSQPFGIAEGPGGRMWFTQTTGKIGRVKSGTTQCKRSISAIQKAVQIFRSIVSPLFDPSVFRRFRDEILSRSAGGRRYVELYYALQPEIARIHCANPTEETRAVAMIEAWEEPVRAVVEGRGSSTPVTATMISSLQAVLNDLKRLGTAELRSVIENEESKLQLNSLVGQSMDQLIARQRLTASTTTTLAAAASLHGVPPAFYHSDVRVFNPASTPVTVTAQYRCMTGRCGNARQTFVLAPREMRTFDDMPGKFFGALESAGAIEFEGWVIVDSRLYTPAAGAPTTGMYVPAVTASEAFSESVLTSLSHSLDGSRGFRTNVGAYNPNDVPLDVRFTLYDAKGNRLGEVVRSTPARTPVQVNNIFAVINVTMDLAGAYCVVQAEGALELFSYASVIDNQSQDLIFVAGRNLRLNRPLETTLPASASLHGVPPTFFHSDVVVFNPSQTTAANVTARYLCFAPPCGKATAFFVVPARGSVLFEDAAVALFEAPESGGAMAFKGDVLVDSRLYTPSRPAPTTGMYVPGLSSRQAYSEALLMSLSHSTNGTVGFRTNAGVYNPNQALNVTFTLYAPNGTSLGAVTRAVPAESPVQVNNIFLAAGVTTDVPNAYCIVRADGGQRLFAYAAVIDNQSLDMIFVLGVDGSAPPP